MASLVSILGRVGSYICLVSISLFIYTSSSGHVVHSGKSYKTYSYQHSFDFPAIITEKADVPKPEFSFYSYPKNEGKPVNTNYQVIRMNTLGLINAHRNV